MDVPPFWIVREINVVAGVNVVGMKRAGITTAEIQAVRKAFKMIYLEKQTVTAAAEQMTRELGEFAAVREIVAFIRSAKRGVPGPHLYRVESHADAA